jgi:methionine-rich copper-binding protein CopC
MTSRLLLLFQRAAVLAVLVAAVVTPVSVSAHAELDVATPKDGATVMATPPEISGTYVQDLADGSSLRLRDAAGTLIAEGIIDPDDDRRMFIAEIPDLAPGEYTVRSTTVSAEDGETDRATWTFTVEVAPTPEPTPSPTPTPAATDAPTPPPSETPAPSPVASSTPSPSPSGGDGGDAGSVGDVLLPIIAAVALVAVGAAWFTRRSRTTPRP